jgi:multiple antibiotic resistance protein
MLQDLFSFSLVVFTGFFAIMNPVANTPVFLGLAEDQDAATRRSTARKAAITAFLIVTVFVLFGHLIFKVFGITIPAFKITGGILVFFVGQEMLRSKKSELHSHDATAGAGKDVAISPLAIPILAGPGTIVTAMNYVTEGVFMKTGIVILIFALMCFLTYLSFNLGEKIVEKLGKNIILVIAKIMGLIIAIIGTQMVITGIKLAFDLKG